MTTQNRSVATAQNRSVAAMAGTGLAAVLMIVNGLLGLLQGITAIAGDKLYAVVDGYAYRFSLTAWGWIHLVIGVLLLLAGFALFTGSPVARAVGVVLAGLGVVANFLWLPYQPFWSIVLIALGLFLIWSLFHDIGPEQA